MKIYGLSDSGQELLLFDGEGVFDATGATFTSYRIEGRAAVCYAYTHKRIPGAQAWATGGGAGGETPPTPTEPTNKGPIELAGYSTGNGYKFDMGQVDHVCGIPGGGFWGHWRLVLPNYETTQYAAPASSLLGTSGFIADWQLGANYDPDALPVLVWRWP